MKTFFFAPESPRPLALMRIGLGLVLFYDAALAWPYVVELYSTAGLPMPLFPGTAVEARGLKSTLQVPFATPPVGALATVALYSLWLFSLAAVTAGWKTRTSLWMALVLSVWFGLLNATGTFMKYSVIGLHLLLLLSFAQSAAVWSLDSRSHRSRHAPRAVRGWFDPAAPRFIRLSPAWPRRLMQILVCSIYWGAAITKIRLADYSTGDFLMFSLLDDRWGGGWMGQWLSTQPRLLIFASMATLFFEMLFPVAVWNARARRLALCCAFAFHLLLATTLTVGIFSPVMLVALLAFLEERDLTWLPNTNCGLRIADCGLPGGGVVSGGVVSGESSSDAGEGSGSSPQTPDDSPLGNSPSAIPNPQSAIRNPQSAIRNPQSPILPYLAAAALWVAAGVGLQYTADWYGVFRGNKSIELTMLDADNVEQMLAGQLPAYEDYFHRVEIGSRVTNAHAVGARDQFRPGMLVYFLARLVQEHPPLTVEVLMLAPDGREVARFSHRLERTSSHLLVPFRLTDELPPGRYRLVLQADGHEVDQKAFTLLASDE